MIIDLAIFATAIAAGCFLACIVADHTNLGAGLAEAVKGRPYMPTQTQE